MLLEKCKNQIIIVIIIKLNWFKLHLKYIIPRFHKQGLDLIPD